MHRANPDEICGLCDEFDADQVTPQCADLGMGRCGVRAEQAGLAVNVAWDCGTCISFRLDRPNLQLRRQFVEVFRRAAAADQEADSPQRGTGQSYEAS